MGTRKQAMIVIPARYASTRLEGKPLMELGGKTIIQRVYERATQAQLADHVVVATDDRRIYDHLVSLGGNAVMTNKKHRSGTDRCIEVSEAFPQYDVVINVQGDEPFIQAKQIDQLIDLLCASDHSIATFAVPILQASDLQNPNLVKVVYDHQRYALYFSRYGIPYQRDFTTGDEFTVGLYNRHIGMYGFQRTALQEIAPMEMHPLEEAEKLEQLRWLANGLRIYVASTDFHSIGIDTPEDLAAAEQYLLLHPQ